MNVLCADKTGTLTQNALTVTSVHAMPGFDEPHILALAALAGMGIAMRHVWVLYHPKFGCGIDVLEQIVNDLPTAKLLPWLFHASGECTAPHEPILGLQVPEWALIWFSLLFLSAIVFAFKCLSGARERAAA